MKPIPPSDAKRVAGGSELAGIDPDALPAAEPIPIDMPGPGSEPPSYIHPILENP